MFLRISTEVEIDIYNLAMLRRPFSRRDFAENLS